MSEVRRKEKETFKVLDGAQVDYGGRYEYLMTAYVSMKLLQDPTVEYFKLSNNHEEFGKFDDLVVETTLRNGETETWAVQLKHSKTGKAISKNELAAEGRGDFSINKYFQDYKKRLYPGNTKLVLYTNRHLEPAKQFEKQPYVIELRKSDSSSSFLDTSETGTVYQLGIEVKRGGDTNQELAEYESFFQSFYIYSNQKNVEAIENELARLFGTIYDSDGQEKYKKYFEKWCREEAVEGCKDKLYKDDIVLELQRILLEPYARPVVPKPCNAKGTLLKTVISKFDVTVIEENCQKHLECLWETARDDGDPFVIKINEDNMKTVCAAIALYKKSFVLIGDLMESRLNHLNIFKNLADLHSEDYKRVTENLFCVIQGRRSECLAGILASVDDELNSRLKQCFDVGQLLKMVENETFVIGDDTVELPMPYINRSIPKHIFSLDLIKNIGEADVLVISCSRREILQRTVSNLKQIETTVETEIADHCLENALIILLRDKCTTEQFSEICSKNANKNVYCFEMLDNELNLLNSYGNLSSLSKFRVADCQTVQDTDILNNFMNKTNILLGDPGMGKTVCADFIKLICPYDFWPIKVNLREKLEVFLTLNCNDLLKQILGSLEFECFRNCYEIHKKFLLIWDGLDEVEAKNVDIIIEKIQSFSRQGYVQWVTSRCHLKEKLESAFDVLSINLVEITVDDQKNYIEARLRRTYEHIHEVTDKIHERIVKNKLKDFLGIPLLLYMFTEICLDTVKYQLILENEISLIQIYGMFVDGKFEHFNQKIVREENALFSKIEDEIKDYRCNKYRKVALRTCFDETFLNQLQLSANCDGFLNKIANDGDVYGIITKIGDSNTPIFIHKTFAEYFAAWYLSKKYDKLDRELMKMLFQPEYKNVRFLFDMFLTENCSAHQAVLELNFEKLKSLHSTLIFSKDKGGRNVFHLASSYGARRMPLRELYTRKPRFAFSKIIKTFDSATLDSAENENKDYEKIVEFLTDLVERFDDFMYKDNVYHLDFVEYANISMSLYSIDAYLRKLKCNYCGDYKDSETILAYSVLFNYTYLFSLQDISYFVMDRQATGTSGFQHFHKFDLIILMIEHNRVDMLQKALKHKTFTNHINDMFNDENSLSWAVRKGYLNIVKLLVRNKAETAKVYGITKSNILHIAVSQCRKQIVEYIVKAKFVHIDACNSSNETPLLIAAKLGNFGITKYLIDNEAAIDVKNAYGENLLHNACKSGNLQLVRYLVLERKLEFETADTFGNTPLLTAARVKDLQIFDFLIEAGANVCAKNAVGWNILHCACSSGSFDFIRNLSKEDLMKLDSADMPKDTPLLVAARYGYFNLANYLLKNGANVLATNFHRKNVLHYACQHGNLEFVTVLSRKDLVALSCCDSENHEPLFYAEKGTHTLIIKYLESMQQLSEA